MAHKTTDKASLEQSRSRSRHAPIIVVCLSLFLSACLTGDIDEIIQRQCPPVAILTTADVLPLNAGTAELQTARLKCFIDNDNEDELLAKVTLSGRAQSKQEAPVFLAVLNAEDRVVARTQYKVNLPSGAFSMTLPSIVYGKKGGRTDLRLAVGFVLSKNQLAENRAALRKKLGLAD
ncbi:MAG: hypothetical protein L7U47_07315 [Alphaproteobacteria bacterium]|nr:hypothetical protein [Alphaproteobacteria bacterium]